MANVSSRLRAARERAGLEIEDIAAATKIKAWQLQAIERGEFERLPGEFFTRAFLRTYAREVGLSADEIVREYDASRGTPDRPAETTRAAARGSTRARDAAPVTRLRGDPEDEEEEPHGRTVPFSSPRSAWPVLALAFVLLMAISAINREPGGSSVEAGAVSAAGVVEASTPPAPTSGTVEPEPEVLAMEIAPTAEIWVNASADGERVIYRLVQPGERLQLTARSELTFRIGNAAAFQYSINGVQGRVLGGPDEVREFQVTRENIRTYHR